MNNVFTIDTEDWYHANFEDDLFSNDSNIISTVEANVDRYLRLFLKIILKQLFLFLVLL